MSDSGLPYAASRDDEFSLLRDSDGFDRVSLGRSASQPEGFFQQNWQIPRAPVRFPLRDALLSHQDPSADHGGDAGMSSVSSKGPIRVQMTQKAKALKYLSHRKRYNLDPPALGEIAPTNPPRAPADVTARRPAKKALNSYGTEVRVQARRNAEDAAGCMWMPLEEHNDAAQSPPPGAQAIRGTLTSSARAVLSHSRRFAAQSLTDESMAAHTTQSSAHSPSSNAGKSFGAAKKPAADPMAAWSPTRQSRGLPKPVREWVCRGLEFTDAGLGIGDRFDVEIQNRADRAPGTIYSQDFGNIARYKSEASMPTKQAAGKFPSCETHKMGARRDTTGKRDRQRPGPGTYETMGFAQALVHKLSNRPKGEAPPCLSPSGSHTGSKTLQASGGAMHA